jgi:hypothetical protein
MTVADSRIYMARPCGNCPFRTDSPPGEFSMSRFRALRATAGTAGAEARFGEPMFACHKTEEGRDRACAGWLATAGGYHMTVRLAVVEGRIPGEMLRPGDDWPELYPTYEDMVDAQYADDSDEAWE